MADDTDRTLVLDGTRYSVDDLPAAARAQVDNIRFCDARLQQLRNELAVADTAWRAYSAAFARELSKTEA